MSKKKKIIEDKYVLRKPTEVSAEISYVNEQAVQNLKETFTQFAKPETEYLEHYYDGAVFGYADGRETRINLELENVKYDINYLDGVRLDLFSIDNMKERINNGESVSSICNDMKEYLIQIKDTNPDLVQLAVAKLLDRCEDFYDEGTDNWLNIAGYTRKHLGNNATEILDKVLNTQDGEQLKGFVCSTISEFGMRLLDECGIKATMIAGGTNSSNHTCLLWQRSDGKYVQSNYGRSYILEASNMKDAAKEVYKKNLGLITNGWIYFVDNSGSWQEFALKEEAMWGDELDKNNYNKESIFNRTISEHPEINGKISVSNLGSFSAEAKGTVVYGNSIKEKEFSWSVGGKKSKNTSIADNSLSIGAKLEYKSEKKTKNGVKFNSTKVVADYTKLTTDKYKYQYNTIQTAENKIITDPEQRAQKEAYLSDLYDAELNFYVGASSLEEYLKVCTFTNCLGEKYNLEAIKEKFPDDVERFINSFTQEYNEKAENFYKMYGSKEEYIQNNIYESVDGNSSIECNGSSKTSNNLTLFARQTFGRESTLFKNKNAKLSQGWQVSGTLGFNDVLTSGSEHFGQKANLASFGGDVRLNADYGLDFKHKNKTGLFDTNATIGGVADMGIKTGCLKPTVIPGVKLNGSMSYTRNINDRVSLSGTLQGNAVVTKVSSDANYGVGINGSYKINPKTTIFAGANFDKTTQQIRIGGFNEQTENYNTIGAFIGLMLKNKGKISVGYSGKTDFLNSTRDRGIFTIGGSINL